MYVRCDECDGRPLNFYTWDLLLLTGSRGVVDTSGDEEAIYERMKPRVALWREAFEALQEAAPDLQSPKGMVAAAQSSLNRYGHDFDQEEWDKFRERVARWRTDYGNVPIAGTAGVCMDHRQLVWLYSDPATVEMPESGALLVKLGDEKVVAAFQPGQWASFETQ